jgi:hypothetical protein
MSSSRWYNPHSWARLVTKYKRGDHIKVEFEDKHSGQAEWMWLEVDEVDEEKQVVFGRLDSQPVLNTDLRLGTELAVSFGKIVDHRNFGGLSAVFAGPRDGSSND